ncbi:MAG: tRNA (N(6)-L-threonylcarbamoyladenosine(37)-C(2))-methylthiotransferase MtaB [Bacteroidota bacterium]
MNKAKKVAFYTIGCKLNFSETSTLSRLFTGSGFDKVGFNDEPDIYVINTCTVTENADRKCRQIIRQVLAKSPDACIAVVGCFAQMKPDEIAGIEGVDIVLGTDEKFNIVEYFKGTRGVGRGTGVENYRKRGKAIIRYSEIDHINQFISSYSIDDRVRSFLKIQDGCDYSCSFCVVPKVRGKSRSDTIENIVNLAHDIAKKGVKEIVLTGVNIGDFGKNDTDILMNTNYTNRKNQNETFYELIQELEKVESIERFRISSIEPNLLSDEIIEFIAGSKRIMPHFHIPLQAGSNKILKLMQRRYSKELFEERIRTIKKLIPHCCIGVDVIVGFPGETEEDFRETCNLLNQLDISYLHVFPYSERENTVALNIKGAVSKKERNSRSKILQNLSVKKRRFFYEQNLNKTGSVLFESGKFASSQPANSIRQVTDKPPESLKITAIDRTYDIIYGFTENYIKVKAQYDPGLVNQVKKVVLSEIDYDGIVKVDRIC